MQTERKWFTIPEDGSVELSPELLAKYGLKAGDEIVVVETEAGLLVTPREQLIEQLLDQVGNSLTSKGVTLEMLMERGRKIRGELLKEDYGIDAEE